MSAAADNHFLGIFLRAKTGSATLLQFIANIALAFVSTLAGVFAGCLGSSAGECISNALVSLILVLLMVAAFGVLLAIGYITQERRDQRLALLLMGAEALASIIFLFDATHSPSWVERVTNSLGCIIAAWVIYVAFRQFRARSGRMVHIPKH